MIKIPESIIEIVRNNEISTETKRKLEQWENQIKILDNILRSYKAFPVGYKISMNTKDLEDCLFGIQQYLLAEQFFLKNQDFEEIDLNAYDECNASYKARNKDNGNEIDIEFIIKCYYKDNYRFEITITKREKDNSQEIVQENKYRICNKQTDLIGMTYNRLTEKDKSKGINQPARYELEFQPITIDRDLSSIEKTFFRTITTNSDDIVFSHFLNGFTYKDTHLVDIKGFKFGGVYKSISYDIDENGIPFCETEVIRLSFLNQNNVTTAYEYMVKFGNNSIVFSLDKNWKGSVIQELSEEISIPLKSIQELRYKIEKVGEMYDLDIAPEILSVLQHTEHLKKEEDL